MDEEKSGLSSEDLLRQAKEALESRPDVVTPEVAHPDVDDPVAIPVSTPDPTSRPLSQDPVAHPADEIPPWEPTTQGSGKVARIIGIVLLVGVAIFWLLVIVGLFSDPTDIGEAIGGVAVVTALPFLLGRYLVRRANRARRDSDGSKSRIAAAEPEER